MVHGSSATIDFFFVLKLFIHRIASLFLFLLYGFVAHTVPNRKGATTAQEQGYSIKRLQLFTIRPIQWSIHREERERRRWKERTDLEDQTFVLKLLHGLWLRSPSCDNHTRGFASKTKELELCLIDRSSLGKQTLNMNIDKRIKDSDASFVASRWSISKVNGWTLEAYLVHPNVFYLLNFSFPFFFEKGTSM